MTTPLWDHQKWAVDFAMERDGTLFHMGMGTGKSRCAIEVAARSNAQSVLILCPLSVCDAWLEQFAQFGRGFRVVNLNKGSVAKKLKKAQAAQRTASGFGLPFVCVVNYESARNAPLADYLALQKFDLLILDESHRIKSARGTTSRWVSRLAQTCKKRLALTGTPMPHSPLDIYAQIRALDPRVFGWSFVKFRAKYAVMGGFMNREVKDYKNLDDLRTRMGNLTFQADRSVLDLPSSTHQRRRVQLQRKEMEMYKEMEHDFCTKVKEGEITAANALVKLLRLQQLTSGRVTVETETETKTVQVHERKQKALEELLGDLPIDEPVVVFGRFTSDLQCVHAAARETGRKSLELSGKRRELKEWQGGKAPILAVQIQSGGTGVDLTRAAYCVYLSTGFSLGDYEQSLARVHRPGQYRAVSYYHIIAEDTVDEKVYRALRDRKKIVESVLADITPTPKEKLV